VLCSLAASQFFALQRGGAAGHPAASVSTAVSLPVIISIMLDTCMQLKAIYMKATPITDTALQPALTLPSDCSLGSYAVHCQWVFWQNLVDGVVQNGDAVLSSFIINCFMLDRAASSVCTTLSLKFCHTTHWQCTAQLPTDCSQTGVSMQAAMQCQL